MHIFAQLFMKPLKMHRIFRIALKQYACLSVYLSAAYVIYYGTDLWNENNQIHFLRDARTRLNKYAMNVITAIVIAIASNSMWFEIAKQRKWIEHLNVSLMNRGKWQNFRRFTRNSEFSWIFCLPFPLVGECSCYVCVHICSFNWLCAMCMDCFSFLLDSLNLL